MLAVGPVGASCMWHVSIIYVKVQCARVCGPRASVAPPRSFFLRARALRERVSVCFARAPPGPARPGAALPHSDSLTHYTEHTRTQVTATHTVLHTVQYTLHTLYTPSHTRARALSVSHTAARACVSWRERPHMRRHARPSHHNTCMSPPLAARASPASTRSCVGVSRLAGSTRHDSLTKSSTRCALGHLESLRPRRTTPRAKSTS